LHAFFLRIWARRGHQIAAVATARKMAALVRHLLAKEIDDAGRVRHCCPQAACLELQAGRPMKKGNQRDPAYAYNVKALRNQEMAITAQAERLSALRGQWQSKPTTKRCATSTAAWSRGAPRQPR
jgi:transposase